MPTREETLSQVAHQMIKSGKVGRVKATTKQLALFKMTHNAYINWALDNLPPCSAAVAAVIVKGLIKYDKERVAEFCNSLKQNFFTGKNDPAYLLWKFLQIHKGKDTSIVYRKTVTALRVFIRNETILYLAPAKTDIFDWDENWTVPDSLLNNWNPNELPKPRE